MGHFGNEQGGLKMIKVTTKDLIDKVRKNREQHALDFTKAEKGFIMDCEVKLKAAMKEVKRGDVPDTIRFEQPTCHTDDYDAILDMLEMSVDEELEITYEQFQRYARDKWDWSANFNELATFYNSYVGD